MYHKSVLIIYKWSLKSSNGIVSGKSLSNFVCAIFPTFYFSVNKYVKEGKRIEKLQQNDFNISLFPGLKMYNAWYLCLFHLHNTYEAEVNILTGHIIEWCAGLCDCFNHNFHQLTMIKHLLKVSSSMTSSKWYMFVVNRPQHNKYLLLQDYNTYNKKAHFSTFLFPWYWSAMKTNLATEQGGPEPLELYKELAIYISLLQSDISSRYNGYLYFLGHNFPSMFN